MLDKEVCACPLCRQDFHPADGLTAAEYLAQGIFEVIREMQEKATQDDFSEDMRQCARCGEFRMIPVVTRNALSRQVAGIYVCPTCGTDEAVRVFADNILPISDWYIIKAILKQWNA